jgi:hypothetical protein
MRPMGWRNAGSVCPPSSHSHPKKFGSLSYRNDMADTGLIWGERVAFTMPLMRYEDKKAIQY